MGDLKGILALFTACISLTIVINFLLFHKNKKAITDGLILGAFLFANQLIEFVSSFWMIDNKILTFIYIISFNFTISFSSYFLLKHLQPESKHNWKAFMFSIMLLPAGFVYFSSFKMVDAGFFLTEYRYFASPMANYVIGLVQSLIGLFFLSKFYFSAEGFKDKMHNKLLFWCYLIPPAVFIALFLISTGTARYFESIYSKLLLLNAAGFLFYLVKQESYARNNS